MIYALLILALIVVFVVGIYNGLVTLKNKCEEAWADIDTQLKRRYDLIPNLVETVKGYAGHEAQTLEKVIQARNIALNAKSFQEKEQAENVLSGALKTIFALSENYPDLKANQNFMDLQKTLKEIEEHVQLSRRYYNATVRDLNTKIEVFPNNFIAGPMGFTKKEFFQANEEEKQNVQVSFKDEPKAAQPSQPEQTPQQAQPPKTTPSPEQTQTPQSSSTADSAKKPEPGQSAEPMKPPQAPL